MADEEGAAPEAPPQCEAAAPPAEAEAAQSPSKVAPPPSASQAVVPPSVSKAAVPPSASQAAVPPSASKAAVPPSASQAVAASPSKVEAETGPKPSRVEAAPSPSKAEAAPTPSKVEAAPTPSKAEAAPTPSKVEAAVKPSKVEAGEGETPSTEKEPQRKSRSRMSVTAGSRISVLAGQRPGMRTSSRQSLASARESLMRVRPASRAFQRSGSFISFRRSSLGFDKMKAMYENSYVLDPKKPFSSDRVSLMLHDLLEGEEMSYPERYDPESARKLAHDVAALLRAGVRDLAFDRYRLVCLCEVVDKRGQTAAHGMRFLWDAERDNFACYTIEKNYYYMIVTVFGIYTD
ncbi:translation initiation factor IF-2-like [Schistocerca gregaria]|uniref:translation initiation factor IF-2-like n=1 Tax=Schistocerca gregaria TaxID=7010 RepID=UPI00211EDD16|nr:translation initiation factor IF-2-like [Schistocerca gregaria]